jgi:catechol 2,3-dioxygenase-like lactoylglutathione lyase family enzyme
MGRWWRRLSGSYVNKLIGIVVSMIEQIDHVNLVVGDIAGMTAFYAQVLGFEFSKEATISGPWVDRVAGLSGVKARVVYLEAAAGPRIELIAYEQPVGICPEGLALPNTMGLRHLAFRVSDIDLVVAKLKAAGIETLSEVQQVPDSQVRYAGAVRKWLVYFHDPENNLLELCEYR